MGAADLASKIVGWMYFFAWSFSFYPQAIENYERQDVGGFSPEFAMLNPCGFFFYSLYSLTGFLYPGIGASAVDPNDLVFAFHAFGLSCVQLTQIFMYNSGKNQKIVWWVVYFIISMWITLAAFYIYELNHPDVSEDWTFTRFCGWMKALITLVKYMP
jgi:cystinosin